MSTTTTPISTRFRHLLLKSTHFTRKEKNEVVTAEPFVYQRDPEADERYINFGKFWEVNYEGLREIFYTLHDDVTRGDVVPTRLFELTDGLNDRRPPEDVSAHWGFLQWTLWVTYLNAPQSHLDAVQTAWVAPTEGDITVPPLDVLLTKLRREVVDIQPLVRSFDLLTRGEYDVPA